MRVLRTIHYFRGSSKSAVTVVRLIKGVIKKIIDENYKVKSFFIETDIRLESYPGQYVMIWYPGSEEIPISIADESGTVVRLLIAKAGATTEYIHLKARIGDYVRLRGPLGKGFTLVEDGRVACVAGGYGVAPLFYLTKRLAEKGVRVHFFLGAKCKEELLLLDELSTFCERIVVSTEDGSYGYRGVITECFDEYLKREKYDIVYTCGPELMMYKVILLCCERGIRSEASLERYIRCGIGLCGSCVLDPIGLRVCCEGPVIDGNILLKTDFGKYKRDECLRRVSISGVSRS
ncbi:MAG: dihydroorotate dehydrogenase electron transfer subunit [Thermoprotei archaeon]|nr:MAG: dihydroorotate dehydrogenase electron transfer subunit [Thermoprotei archaeon]